MKEYIYGGIYTLIYISLLYVFAQIILVKRRRFVNSIAIVALSFLFAVIEFIFSALLNDYIITKIIVIILLNSLYVFLIFNANKRKSIALGFFYQLLCLISDYISFTLLSILNGELTYSSVTSTDMAWTINCVSQLTVFIILMLIRSNKAFSVNHEFLVNQWFEIMLVPCFSIGIIIALYMNFNDLSNHNQQHVILCLSFGLVAINLYVFNLVHRIAKETYEKKNIEILAEQNKQSIKRYNEMKSQYEILRSKEHEFRNEMMVIYSYANQNRIPEIIKTTSSYFDMDNSEYTFDTNNPILNVIFNERYIYALKKNILITFKFNDLSKLSVSDVDLSIIVSNLINNAIEATDNIKSERYINTDFYKEDNSLFIKISNPYIDDLVVENTRYISTKANPEFHGYGIENVKKAVLKYGGIYTNSIDDNIFTVIINIPLQEVEGEYSDKQDR